MPVDNGRKIGEQHLALGGTIVPKLPSDSGFENPFPSQDDPRRDNIKFNTDERWEIFDPSQYNGETLAEGQPFNYGSNLDVRATWWKKVEIKIWCYLNNYAENDLKPYVHVLGGHETAQPYDIYSFFSDGDNVNFNITNINNRIINVSGRVYRFIGWSETEPTPWSTIGNPFHWCTNETSHLHANIEFPPLCLHKEYAAFADGTEIDIIVKTNDPNPGETGSHGWNNSGKIRYKLTWETNDTHIQPFNSEPVDITNPAYSDITHDGQSFVVETNPDDDITHLGVFELKGWYFGNFNGFDVDQYNTISQSENFYAGNISQTFYAVSTPIIITAVYMPASQQYTITYYSGLPQQP